MNDEAIAAGFNGRPTVEVDLTGFTAHRVDRITWIAMELGYALRAEEMQGRGAIRLTFTRDDSPASRQRAQATLARVQAAGSWHAVTTHAGPAAQAADPSLVPPLHAAKAVRTAKAYEGWHPAQVIVTCIFGAVVCLSMALAARGSAAVSTGSCALGALFVIGAVLGPRYARRRQEKNRQLLDDLRRQEAARFWVPLPPPPPPLPPAPSPHDQTGK